MSNYKVNYLCGKKYARLKKTLTQANNVLPRRIIRE